ncbi:epithelial-stromal interaction protein 1 isoform X2 [Triplophysa rosa]|uniref:epithelial-stromal interaction protein 1 isoform X2 n=1 Tax=Triplophysa rosa TaxID=992332 RepID=UPI0025460A98|nr:epithelial-stromal interaction protein 1 isoform X2 [Triplophysa rosa]
MEGGEPSRPHSPGTSGAVSLEEVRQKQQQEARQVKLKKRLQKEEIDRKNRQAEEEENQQMKDKQRDKANKLEMKRKQEEQRRQDLYQHDQQMKNREFLQKVETSNRTVPMAASNSIPASSWAKCQEYRESKRQDENAALLEKKEEQRRKAEILEEKLKQEEEDRKRQIDTDHRRVNLAFLNRLEASTSGRMSEPMANTPVSSNICEDDEEIEDPASSPVPNPLQGYTEEEGCVQMWAVMKLQCNFPYYERDMLEDILRQCNGDYQQAYELLNV